MIIHQAFYGEVNRGHARISQSLDNSELTSFLISFTDRPAALPPGVVLQPYLSGTAWSNYYIFTKSFPDPYATRSGMVFTHALMTKLDNLKFITDLKDIFNNFVVFVPEKREELSDINLKVSPQFSITFSRFQPKYIKECLNTLLKNKTPILFSGNNQSFENVIQQIWNVPNIDLRKKIRFRVSFAPSDIEDVKDLTVVTIQKEFISKWPDRKIINGEDNEQIEITSHSESFLLGLKENNPFYSFLIELNIDQSNFSIFSQLDKIFNDYNRIAIIDDADIIRQNIRILSIVSPSMFDGIAIKNKFIARLIDLVQLGKERNFKALRNLTFSAFEKGENRIRQVFSKFIELELESPNADIYILTELFELAFYEEQKNWWHETIKFTSENIFSRHLKSTIENLWKILNHSVRIVEDLLNLTPKSIEFETQLRKNLPDKLEKLLIIKLENISKQRKWVLLHADILLKYLKPKDAIVKQLFIEKDLTIENSVGVLYLIEKLDDEKLLSLTLINCDDKLVHQTVNRIAKNKRILNNLDVKNPNWIKIWALSLVSSKNLSYGIESKEIEVVNAVLDLIISNETVPIIIIESISKSDYANITNYAKRKESWCKISPSYIQSFIEKTSAEVLTQYIIDKIAFDSIEETLLNYISSDTFMTSFLQTNSNNIEPVIKVYESFPNLKDTFLADYIKYFPNSIGESVARRLGSLVYRLNYNDTAKSIYDKSKYSYSFRLANEQSKYLISIPWWDIMWSKRPLNSHNEAYLSSPKDQTKFEMIKSLPTVVILTAIIEEYNAVRAHLINLHDADRNDTVYEVGLFKVHDKEIANVVIRECGAKNTVGAQETERAIMYFKPQILLFVGIAGSRKPNDFKIGDVIFPKEIYSYEAGKSEKDSFKVRPDLVSTTYTLLELAKKERRKQDWKSFIKNNLTQDVKADIGIIASGEQIIEHYESEIGRILTNHYNDTSAVEMEGFGFAKAATRQGKETSNMLVGVVRGISDIIVQPQNNERAGSGYDRRTKNAKKIASDNAAAFAYWLIFKNYE